MDDVETPTAPVQPLEAEPQTDPALTGPVEAQPSPEAAPAEPKEAEAGAEEPKPWVDVKEVEGLREHVTPLLEDAEKTGYDKRTGEFDQYAQPYLQQHSQRLNDINSGIGRMAKGLESLVKVSKSDGGTVDGEVDAQLGRYLRVGHPPNLVADTHEHGAVRQPEQRGADAELL